MRLVLDTNIVLSGVLYSGAPLRIMDVVAAGRVEVFTSDRLLDELDDVLSRDKHTPKIGRLGQTPAELLDIYARYCTLVDAKPLPARIAPDPDDDWVIATAIAAEADLIVTGDKPLLAVGSVGAIRIVTVGEALALVGRM